MSVVNQPMPNKLETRWFESPAGPVEVGVNLDLDTPVIWYVEFMETQKLTDPNNTSNHPILIETERQLKAYFKGEAYDFEKVLQYQSDYGTEFQKQVWQALTQIPAGTTWSYGQLAKHINRPKAVRAVGAANGKNPLAVIIPCHRVIGANGTLTGYAGGLDIKAKLIELEQQHSKS